MTRDETRPFALGEPCAQNKEGELLWSFDAIAQAVEEARAAEREACAQVCIEHACKHPYPSHAGASAAVCADAIRARGQQ